MLNVQFLFLFLFSHSYQHVEYVNALRFLQSFKVIVYRCDKCHKNFWRFKLLNHCEKIFFEDDLNNLKMLLYIFIFYDLN
jgi:hypothetical protein